MSTTTPAPSWPRIAGNSPSGSAPESVNSSVWQMPVALISTSTSPACGPVEIDGFDRQRRAGLVRDCGFDFHCCYLRGEYIDDGSLILSNFLVIGAYAFTSRFTYRGRFAPSPTGPLHFGSLVAAVGSYLDARQHGGEWLVRIEDIDTPRTVAGRGRRHPAHARRLRHAARRRDRLPEHAQRRLSRGAASAAPAQARLSLRVQPARNRRFRIARHRGPVYPGTCRNGIAGKTARAWRVDTRGARIAFDDAVQGRIAQNLETDIGDFVLYRADDVYAYHLAVVIDDAEQGITDVVRGADLLDSTPRQI